MSTGPSWKHSGGQPSSRPATSRKSWQPGQTPAAKKPGSPSGRYRMRVAAAGVSLTALIGLIIFLIWMWAPTKTPGLVVVAPAAADSTAAPPNAASGAGDLAAEFDTKKSRPRTAGAPDPKAGIDNWFQHIDAETKLPLVLHFACPGAADKDGPFLWFVPSDAEVAEPGHKLHVEKILTYVDQALVNDPPVLLIFDAATEPAAWARGQLHNDFARQLKSKKLDDRIKDIPNLVVICSADEDQRSWVADERRQTAFAHYLREALRGVGFAANEQVQVRALFDKVQKNVSDWAQANRDAAQKPFLLPTGESERVNQIVVVAPDDAKPTPLPTGGGYPDALKAAWREQWRRAALSPPPEATAPHVWRQYLDLLLKADRAARATQGELPDDVRARLTALETELDVRPWANPPDCVPYALPAATALWEPRTAIAVAQIQAVFTAPTAADRLAAWTDLAARTSAGDRARPEVRLAGADAILQYLLLDQTPLDQATLDRAAEVLQHIDGSAARPVETHLVHMFKRHLKNQNPVLVRLAIQVQIAAEQAAWFSNDAKYPHAEQVARWFGPELQRADERRREQTDLVFAGTTAGIIELPEPLAASLQKTREEYEDLARRAAALGRAYRLRDTVLTRLPYYARWAAARRIPKEAADPILRQIEYLADKAHYLTDLLEKPTPGDTKAVLDLADKLQTGDAKNPGFDLLVKTFEDIRKALAQNPVPVNWHALDAALEVPFIAPDDRAVMIEKAREISRVLEAAASFTGAATTAVDPQEMAQRQGRMAVAVLGRRGFGARAGGMPKDDVVALIDRPDRTNWSDSLAAAGAEIGAAFSALPKQASASVKEGAQRTPETAAAEIEKGAALARLIDGATRMPAKTINPVAEERRYRTHLLLIAQAKRAAADGWADIRTAGKYSADAAQAYLASADVILFSGSPVPESERERWKAHFPQSLPEPRFTFETRPGFSVTNQADERLPYTLTPTGGAAGYPVLKVHSIVAPVTADKLKARPADTYVPVVRFAGPQMAPHSDTVTLGVGPAKDGDKGGVKLDLLYRGWVESRTVVADYAGTPIYEWIYTPPRNPPNVTVRGSNALRDGAVAFILDASASMGNRAKYSKTIEAMRDILKDLPEGTMVSVHYFAGGEGPNGDLTEVLPPTNWTEPGNQAALLHKKLSQRELNGELSPISAAIGKALTGEKVFAKTASGHRSLIVLTDGAENTDDENPGKANYPSALPGEGVLKILKAAQKAQDVALHLMLVGVTETGYKNARAQFGLLEDITRNDLTGTLPTIWPRPDPKNAGKPIGELTEAGELKRAIRESMLPRIIIRDLAGNEVGTLPVSIPETDRHWAWLARPLPVEKGKYVNTYQVSLAGSRQTHQRLELAPGDRVVLDLEKHGNKLTLTLPSYGRVRDGMGGLDRVKSTPDRLEMTVPRNFLTPHGGDFDLEMTATLENPLPADRAQAGLARLRPVFAWFEINPRGVDGPPKRTRVRVENLADRFAPAWRLTAGPWINGAGGNDSSRAAPATVTGYWLDSMPADSDRLVLATADTKPTPEQMVRRVGGKRIEIRELTVKDRTLLIDLAHEPRFPVVVRLKLKGPDQEWTVSERHLFFDNSQYTATFEGINPEDLRKEMYLDFYLIDGVKARAQADNTKLIVDVRNNPQANDPRDLLPEQTDAQK